MSNPLKKICALLLFRSLLGDLAVLSGITLTPQWCSSNSDNAMKVLVMLERAEDGLRKAVPFLPKAAGRINLV